jgi:hypothetical protein
VCADQLKNRRSAGTGRCVSICGLLCLLAAAASGTVWADELPKLTTLSDSTLRYTVPEKGYAVLERGDVRAVVVDNRAVEEGIIKGHKAGYSGVASLTHKRQPRNLFVENYAGLNFEHILDGTRQERDILFEPRHAPMELRAIDEHAVELHQAPTPHYGLESCSRYELLEDGTIQFTFECIPRRETFKNGYILLFWASYIDHPESLDIHFKGFPNDGPPKASWIRGVTPAHGKLSTHLGPNDRRELKHDDEFPLTLVYNLSNHRYAEPWYFGVSRGMAFAQVFRPRDEIRLCQSPSGGGAGCPAWDFQFVIPNYKVGQRYQMVMRAVYTPFESNDQVERLVAPQMAAFR